ncbi:MAG TPA: SAM-dependent methyltransferase [Acetobacteraceae bacterium]|nr:SAM-dependent methyltransferase [Acetobacteraceae bacterium]
MATGIGADHGLAELRRQIGRGIRFGFGRFRSHGAAHFQRLYDANPDPWGFRTSAYEQAKYQRTIAALGDRRFDRGFEVGCSIGVFTRLLAQRCRSLLAVDIVEAPLISARENCADLPQVQFNCMDITTAWPEGRFDLIVLSEVLYFLSPAAIAGVARRATSSLAPDGLVVLVNWLGKGDDPLSGDDAAQHFIAAAAHLAVVANDRQARYRIDLLRASDA